MLRNFKRIQRGIECPYLSNGGIFYGGSLKQDYNLKDNFDRDIENFVREIDASWYNNPYQNPNYIRQ
ncbi:hypothetical protein [Niabella hibiscisoli]|uniref:hypothetical protein n=1 Tax=Niabella hibiscisoli TaxID=1825928 RepID=UPI001F0F9097|nr:hypothetical protein [Niabella hibiscisoli]MCH5720626.1 hypothetical protein [Niabella hibiscisoli]